MKPIYLPLSELVQHPNNPREITNEAMEGLKQSLVDLPELTEANPLIVSNRTGKYIVLGGNQRVEAAKQNGWVEIPCNVMEGLTEAKENEIIIKLNTHYGEWDINKLGTWAVEDLSAWGVPEDVLLNWTESVERADWNGIDDYKPEGDNSKTDYSSKNKEIDIDALDQTMVLKLYYSEDVYDSVKERLEAINPKIENALLNLLDNVS